MPEIGNFAIAATNHCGAIALPRSACFVNAAAAAAVEIIAAEEFAIVSPAVFVGFP